ncbi:DMT family transporter [Rhodohalobacter sp. SW132]|uniref:DMT family transporter n=1 Tax=Rhodohalobacter sp. SW132 TaxID=2293433 RepID=UPI000E2267F1|nr:DMT family transporter [Rhodohalobacter sp. SW132]REL33265.1 DMT family transporter [Rhodohalobacter sp. SW132]
MDVTNRSSVSHHSLLTLFTFFWGANFILAEIALREMSPISFSVSRFAVGGIMMLMVLYAQCYADAKRENKAFQFFPKIEKKDWGKLLIVAVLGATLAPWLGIEGLDLTHGSRASIWLALGPAISTGCGLLMRTEKLGRYGYIGILLAGVGTLIMAFDGLRPGQGYWAGDLLLLVALAMTVVELHLIKPLAKKYGSISMVAMRTAIGGSLYLVIASPSLAGEEWLTFGFWTWFAIIAGGGIGVGIGQWVKVRALRQLGPTRVVIYGNLVPLAAMFIAWLSIGENPSVFEIVAGGLIIAGAILIQVIDVIKRNKVTTPDEDQLSVVSSGKQD